MTAFRSSLGEESEDIATQLAENQREISIAEFFEKNKHMLGFDSGARALVTATKEAVDNSLDAIEEAGVLPDIYVEISEVDDYYRIVVEDNGPGITKEQIPKVFGKLLYGSRFHVREQSLLPDEHVMLRSDGEIVLRPIEEVWDDQAPSAVGEACLPIHGDVQAPCFDRDTGDVNWQDVTHVIRHGTDGSTVRIRTDDGRSIAVTGNHSLFSVDSSGRIVEVRAGELDPGDEILVPHTIPSPADVSSINLVEELPADAEGPELWIVHEIEPEVVDDLPHSTGEEVGDGEGTAAIDGAGDGSLDSSPDPEFETEANPPESGDKRSFLPLATVRNLGLADRVSTGVITTSPDDGGSATGLPVTLELTPARLRTLGRVFARRAAASNHATSGMSHGSDAGVQRDGAGTEPSLIDVWEAIVGGGDDGLRLPAFVFRANARCQRAFLEGLTDSESDVDSTVGDARSWFETVDGDVGRWVTYLGTMVGAEPVWEEQSVDDDAEIERTIHRIGLRNDAIGVDDGIDTVTTDRKRGEDRRPSSPDASDGSRTTTADRPAVEPGSRPLTTDGGTKVSSTHDVTVSSGGSGATTVGEVRLRTVVDVDPVRSTPYVYDISVPGTGSDENFVAGNRGPVCVRNSRGQQGIGISAAVLYAQLTSGKPVRITSRTNGDDSANFFELIIDTDSNEPEIKTSERTTWERTHGTRIELEMEANMRARTQLHDYIQQTAVVNPHARIEFHEPKGSWKFERATDELPAETSAIHPHPHGVELGTVIKMLKTTSSHSVSGFLREEFSRVGRKTADGILDAFRDRHFGREIAWSSPEDGRELARAIAAATANKTSEATAAFADGVRSGVEERQRIAHFDLETLVDTVADRIEEEFEETFGRTVRENAVEAAWEVIGADRRADLYGLIEEATSSRKDDATIDALAERLATKFDETEDADDGGGGTVVDRRDRLTEKRLRTYVDRAADMTEEIDGVTVGETARENIVETIWGVMRTVPDEVPKVKEVAADRNAASDLVEAMRSVDVMAPPTDCLAPITDELIEAGLRKEYDAEFYAATTRGAGVHAGDPFVVEAGIAYGGELDPEGPVDILRFANRVPLVYQRGACAITDVVRGIGWRNYKLEQPGGSGIPNGPAVILVHVASTNVPFTSESKDAVANVPEIEDEIELAIREAAREMKRYLNKRQSLQQRKRKQSALATILPRMAEKLAEVTDRDPPNIDDALARIMNNVLVERRVEDGTIQIVVENHTGGAETVTLTDIVSAEPSDVEPDGASVVEMDGEWFVRHEATIASGERETLEYRLEDDEATYELDVDGVEDAKLTVTEEA